MFTEAVRLQRLEASLIIPENVIFAPWKEWDPQQYLKEYCTGVGQDEMETIKYEASTLKSRRREFPFVKDDLVVAEIGSGPTISHIIPVAPYAKEIHMYEYLPQNRREIERWLSREEGAHDWSQFTDYTLRCEGNLIPSREDIEAREEEVREKVKLVEELDLGDKSSLDKVRRKGYDFVVSAYCADSATDDKEVWARYMRSIASFVAPTGTLMLTSLKRAKLYVVGDKYFPSANIDEYDLRKVLELDFYPKSIRIINKKIPRHKSQGYGGILLSRAIKM